MRASHWPYSTYSKTLGTRAIAYAIEQPAEVEINEVVLRPTVQGF